MLKQKLSVALVFSLFAMTATAGVTADAEVDLGETLDCGQKVQPISVSPLPDAVFPLEKQEKAYFNQKNDLERDMAECTSTLAFARCIDQMETACAGIGLVAQIVSNKDISHKLLLLKERALEFKRYLVALQKHQSSSK